jgi:hypothetical protein
VFDTVRRPREKLLSLCGKANIDGYVSWTGNLTQGLQIRQPDDLIGTASGSERASITGPTQDARSLPLAALIRISSLKLKIFALLVH